MVHARDGSNRASSLAVVVVSKLQFLLLYFKKWCEDDVLKEESKERYSHAGISEVLFQPMRCVILTLQTQAMS